MNDATITAANDAGDRWLGSQTIQDAIRCAFAALSKRPFDPATGALPLRPDVHFTGADYLCGPGRAVFYPAGMSLPDVILHPDGTATIRFARNGKGLDLVVLCKGTIRAVRHLSGGTTRIESYLPGEPIGDGIALDEMVEWLAGTRP